MRSLNISSSTPLEPGRSMSTTKGKRKKKAVADHLSPPVRSSISPRSPSRASSQHYAASSSQKFLGSSNSAAMHAQSDSEAAFSVTLTSEGIIFDQLVALMTILLKSNASKTFHDFSLMQNHIHGRAVAAVEEELRVIQDKLVQLRGANANHRNAAFAQLFSSLNRDVEAAVFNVDRRTVANIRNDQQAVRRETEELHAAWNEKIARKDQTILAMQSEHAAMDFKNKSLVRTVELLSKELEKCSRSLSDVHQKVVEIRMQGIDFKGEVDRRAQRVLHSIQARVGFVPESIQKHVALLSAMLVSELLQ